MTENIYAAAVAALCILPAWTFLVLKAHFSMWHNLRGAIRRSDDLLRLYDVARISTETHSSGLLIKPTARIRVDLKRTRRPVVLIVRNGEDAASISARMLAAVEDRLVGAHVDAGMGRRYGQNAPEARDGCWDTLGIDDAASVADINLAWRGLARDAHPDAGGSNERMAVINAARTEALKIRRRR
jgi:hypothetical protein